MKKPRKIRFPLQYREQWGLPLRLFAKGKLILGLAFSFFLLNSNLFAIPLQYGISYYSDPLYPVLGYDLGKVLGNSEGVSLQSYYYKDNFLERNLYWKIGIGLDIPFPKKVKDVDIEYTHSAFRLELPMIIGITSKEGVYIGAGISPIYYRFSYKDNYGTSVDYVATNFITFYKSIGIKTSIRSGLTACLEINSFEGNSKAKVREKKESGLMIDIEKSVLINPRYNRVYFSLIQDF